LVADPDVAYVLETAGRSWAYRQVSDFGSISNGLTIEENYDEAHFERENHTIQRIFAGKKESFRGRFSDLIYTRAGKSKLRQACTMGFLKKKNQVETKDFFEALRQHDRYDFDPKKATTASICMHATGFTNPSDTTGSMVAEIRKNSPSTIWLTATPHPCMSVYIPFFLGETFDLKLLSPSAEPDQSLWWQAKKLHKKVGEDFSKNQPILRGQLDLLQDSWLLKEAQLIQNKASNSDFKNFNLECLEEYKELIKNFS
jgi:dipeptidase